MCAAMTYIHNTHARTHTHTHTRTHPYKSSRPTRPQNDRIRSGNPHTYRSSRPFRPYHDIYSSEIHITTNFLGQFDHIQCDHIESYQRSEIHTPANPPPKYSFAAFLALCTTNALLKVLASELPLQNVTVFTCVYK